MKILPKINSLKCISANAVIDYSKSYKYLKAFVPKDEVLINTFDPEAFSTQLFKIQKL